MKKKNASWYIVGIIFLVVFHVTIFAIPFNRTAIFWLSYAFTLVSALAQIYVFIIAFSKRDTVKSKLYGFPIAKIGICYLLVQMLLCIVFLVVAAFAYIPFWLPLVIYVIWMGVFFVGIIANEATSIEVEKSDEKLESNVGIMRKFQSQVNLLADIAKNTEAEVELSQLADELRFSDPVSSKALRDKESELAICLDEIQKFLSDREYASVIIYAKKARMILKERNRLCKFEKASL